MVWNATNAALTRLGFDPTGVRRGVAGLGGDPTGVRSSDFSTRNGDPTGVGQYDPGSLGRLGEPRGFDPLMDFGMKFFEEQNAKSQQALGQFGSFWGQQPQMGGGMANLGGDWAGVDQWNSAIQSAASQFGVPANLIKAVMKLESNGQNLGPNSSLAVGPMQVTTNNWSNLGYNLYDPNQNIMAGAKILKMMYDQMGSWEGATRAYFAGPGGAYSGNRDSFGTNPDTYWATVSRYWDQLNNATAGGTAGSGFGSGVGGLSSMFGTNAANISYEYGVESDLGFYDYGTAYGMNGHQHTGIDVAMPYGTPYRAPAAGTIVCAGSGVGSGADGSGCGFFENTAGGGGRVELLLDNGVVLIFGHSSKSVFRPGQRVKAGDVIGYSGTMNGDHVHLEARVKTANGWKLVDPRTVLGGGGGFSGGFTPAPTTGSTASNPFWYFLTTPGAKW